MSDLIWITAIILNIIITYKSMYIRENIHTNCFTLPIHLHHVNDDYTNYPHDSIKHPIDCPDGSFTYVEHKQHIKESNDVHIQKMCCLES